MRGIVAAGAVVLMLGAGAAAATVGGETVVDVLGFEPATQRIYLRIQTLDGASRFGRVLYLEPGGPRPDSLRTAFVAPPGEGSDADSALTHRLAQLRAGLQPLRVLGRAMLPWRTTTLSRDSVVVAGGRAVRHRVRVEFGRDGYELDSYGGRDDVAAIRYAIPGRPERLLVLAFVGDPFEGGYEVQVPLLASDADRGFRLVSPVRGW